VFYTHINRGKIDSNRKHGTDEPVVRFQRGKHGRAIYAHEVEIPGPSRVIYSPHEPILPCGARMVITSEVEPVVVR
jgi:hypothetical protein